MHLHGKTTRLEDTIARIEDGLIRGAEQFPGGVTTQAPGKGTGTGGGPSGVGVSAIMGACGVSKSTAWSWKMSRTIPAPVHWRTLALLAGVELSELVGPAN
jgi:hypothetical protein